MGWTLKGKIKSNCLQENTFKTLYQKHKETVVFFCFQSGNVTYILFVQPSVWKKKKKLTWAARFPRVPYHIWMEAQKKKISLRGTIFFLFFSKGDELLLQNQTTDWFEPKCWSVHINYLFWWCMYMFTFNTPFSCVSSPRKIQMVTFLGQAFRLICSLTFHHS